MWAPILSLAIKMILWFLERQENADRQKTMFLEFVAAMEKDQLLSVKLNQSYREQVEAMKARRVKATWKVGQ